MKIMNEIDKWECLGTEVNVRLEGWTIGFEKNNASS